VRQLLTKRSRARRRCRRWRRRCAKQPPAQEGDAKEEVKVAKAEPVLLPTVDQAKADLDANPARTSVLSKDGHVVRE
jgi:hypothetical protein